MSNRTWVCLDCRKSFRRYQGVQDVICSVCGRPCEYVDWKLHIPSPKKVKEWDAFWTQYLFEKRAILRFEADTNVREITLPLLNQKLVRTPLKPRPPKAWRKRRTGGTK